MFLHTLINKLAFSPSEFMGMPENHSAHGDQVIHMIDVITWFMIALFVGWTIFFFICLIKFRAGKNKTASYQGVKSHASTHCEIGVVIVEAVLLLGFALPLWSERTDGFDQAQKDNALRVRAVGYQFNWNFHYAGADNKFGYIDRSLAKKQGDACIDPEDENGFDDFITGTLKIPVDRTVILQVTSTDVIHNFSIIPMRIQSDAIPGKDIPMWFTPISELKTSVVCGQLCGEGHARMVGKMEVISQKDFKEFLTKQSEQAVPVNKAKAEKIKAAREAKAAQAKKDLEKK